MLLKPFKSQILPALGCVFLFLTGAFSQEATVDVSTATGHKISYDDISKTARIEGNARVVTSTGTLSADSIFLDNNRKMGHAVGNVVLESSTNVIKGTEAYYYWQSSTGTIYGAEGTMPPWRFFGDPLHQVDQSTFRLLNGGLTSCELNPPHYLMRFSRAKMIDRHRLNLQNPQLGLEDTGVFWFPFATKSLVPKKWTLRIEPGRTSRDGYTLRNIFGYPITRDSQLLLKYNWLELTGNGVGMEYLLEKPFVNTDLNFDYLRDTNSDPQPQRKRYSLFWNHYQKFNQRMTFNGKVEYKSDQAFGNDMTGTGNGTLVENQDRGLMSEIGLNYQWSQAALRIDAKRQDKYDSAVSSEAFISALVLPQVTLNTVPMKFRRIPFYTSVQASWINTAPERASPSNSLRYERSANVQVLLNRDIMIKRVNFTPSFQVNENWQSSTSPYTTKDVYLGRYTVALNARKRLSRRTNVNLNFARTYRSAPNSLKGDSSANDHGIEQSQLNAGLTSRWGQANRWSLNSGYDLRSAPKNDPQYYHTHAARITPLSFDGQFSLNPVVTVFYRTSYSFYNPLTRKAVNTPINSSGEIQFGNPSHLTFFSQGFNHSQTQPGQKQTINLTNKIKFFLTSKWHIDYYLSYQAITNGRLDLGKVKGNENTLQVVRDLHCWLLRMQFSRRPDRTDASFYIDLKTNVASGRDIFAKSAAEGHSSYRQSHSPLGDIFPNKE